MLLLIISTTMGPEDHGVWFCCWRSRLERLLVWDLGSYALYVIWFRCSSPQMCARSPYWLNIWFIFIAGQPFRKYDVWRSMRNIWLKWFRIMINLRLLLRSMVIPENCAYVMWGKHETVYCVRSNRDWRLMGTKKLSIIACSIIIKKF